MPTLTPPAFVPAHGNPESQRRAVEASRQHLAATLNIPPDQIALLRVEPQTWPDASLGCPKPGWNYAQIITPGWRILLEAGGQTYELHSDQSSSTILMCTSPEVTKRIPLRRGLSRDEIVEEARRHLVRTLQVPVESVSTAGVEDAEWDDPSLGCGDLPGKQPDRAYPGGIPGLLILLETDGQVYEYHSGGLWLVFCGLQGGFLVDPNSR